jgi:Mn2+/Fe2+ NRAMP family transporter
MNSEIRQKLDKVTNIMFSGGLANPTTYVGKLAGFVSALNVIPFVDLAVGVLVFAAASLLKDTVNRIGDLVDDGLPNSSFES